MKSLQAAPATAAEAKIRIGACMVDLDQARQAGLEGVEVGVGDAAERLDIADPKVQTRYKEQMQKTGLPICSLMMGLFNGYPLATDPRAPAWIEQSIDAAHDLGAQGHPAGLLQHRRFAGRERTSQRSRRGRGRQTHQGCRTAREGRAE